MDHKRRIKDFYEGKLSHEEAKRFLEFLESQEAEEFLSAEIIQLWSEKIKADEYRWDSKALWSRIKNEKTSYARPYLYRDPEPKRSKWGPWFRAAAVFVLIGASAVLFVNRNKYNKRQGQEQLLEARIITKKNPSGQKSKLVLPDGSTVYLNSESSISYSADFISDRSISLDGEGFFEVVKDSEHPFRVKADGIVTTALGTSFNISTFRDDQKVAVTLVSGKVVLSQEGTGSSLELDPGEESLLSTSDIQLEKHSVNTQDVLLWTRGILKFKNSSFKEMIEQLSRWYGVEITVKGTMRHQLANGTFDTDESLENVLTVLGESLDFRFEINGKKVRIQTN